MKLVSAMVIGLTLAGCASSPQQQLASSQPLAQTDEQRCRASGLKPGTPAYDRCLRGGSSAAPSAASSAARPPSEYGAHGAVTAASRLRSGRGIHSLAQAPLLEQCIGCRQPAAERLVERLRIACAADRIDIVMQALGSR